MDGPLRLSILGSLCYADLTGSYENDDEEKDADDSCPDEERACAPVWIAHSIPDADAEKYEGGGCDADGEAALAKACKDGHDQSRSDACKQRSKKREESSEGPEGRVGRDRRGVFEVLGGIVK